MDRDGLELGIASKDGTLSILGLVISSSINRGAGALVWCVAGTESEGTTSWMKLDRVTSVSLDTGDEADTLD
jgi:hypothetical protein